jgi:hypothetical protein
MCKSIREVLRNSPALWYEVVQCLLEFSPSFAVSHALQTAKVDELRDWAMRFSQVQRTVALGQTGNLPTKSRRERTIALSAEHYVVAMVLIPGTRLFVYVDATSKVHVADLTTGRILDTWESTETHTIHPARPPHLFLWESRSDGLVLVIHIRVKEYVQHNSDEVPTDVGTDAATIRHVNPCGFSSSR